MDSLRDSIFIPRFTAHALTSVPADHINASPEWGRTDIDRCYGTRTQTVVLVANDDGRVVFTERTLYDESAQPLSTEKGETKVIFHVEGWDNT